MVAERRSLCYAVNVKMVRGALWDKEERKMRRWVWRILLTAVVMAALTVGASAAEVTVGDLRYDGNTVVGPVESKRASITSAEIASEVGGVPITKIGDHAFEGCNRLSSISIPPSIDSIGVYAFTGCTVLNNMRIPDNVNTIGTYAFAGCQGLTSIALPPATNLKIENFTFLGCSGLREVYFPSGAATIDEHAFDGCTNLKIIHYNSASGNTPPTQNAPDDKKLEVHGAAPLPVTSKPATCTENGSQTLTVRCYDTKCNGKVVYTESKVIPALGHSPDPDPAHAIARVEPTCAKPGTTEGIPCLRCGGVASGVEPLDIDPDRHEGPVENVPEVPATCTESGFTAGERCAACRNYYKDKEPQEIDPLGHIYDGKKPADEPRTVRDATCARIGMQVYDYVCDRCGEVMECPICKANEGKEVTTTFLSHFRDTQYHHSVKSIPKLDHTWGPTTYDYEIEADKPSCIQKGKLTAVKVCAVCGEKEWDRNDTKEEDMTAHTPPDDWKEEILEPGDCETPEKKRFPAYECQVCHQTIPEEIIEGTAPGKHTWKDDPDFPEKITKAATCTEEGEMLTAGKKCSVCGKTIPQETKTIPMTAHTWTNPQPDEDLKDQDKAATCGEEGVSHVIVTCSVCGKVEHQTITIPATGIHEYGEWTVTKQPTATEEGEESRTCSKCGKVDTRPISPTGPVDPDDPDDPDKPDKPENSDYKIVVIPPSNGSVTASKSTAKQGETVTVTYTANSGYVLDMIRVIGGASLVSYTDLGGGQIRFTMPASDVEVRVTFDQPEADYSDDWAGGFGSDGQSRSDPRRTTDVVPVQRQGYSVPQAEAQEQVFQDVPTGHWAAGEINWASEMGYMSGTGGRFNPDGLISHQQMWMVLARLTGANPANMKEARNWAVRGGYADGSAPTGAVKRHQLVTALYRCARLTGTVSRNNTSLAGFTDSTAVPVRAREAFSWALTSGVVSGDAEGRLNPAKTLTRAEFASILYCYSQRH